MNRPEKNEYYEYYGKYVSLVSETEIIPALEKQISEIQKLSAEISEEKAAFAYAEGKWTIKELLGHLIDTEKIFAYRAMRIARGDKTPMEGYEQDGYIENANFNDYTFSGLIEELTLARQTNLSFFKNLSDEAWLRTGTASGYPFSVRALAYISVGHIRHHANILKTRYLSQ